ncbi:MAG: DnaJ domain-containing protein [Dehalococcoidia bacterium]
MESTEDYYEILQVHHLAEPEVIEVAYKKLAQKYHPDLNKSTIALEKMKKINIAHDVLSDHAKRRAYDIDRQQSAKTSSGSLPEKPKPTVDPHHIEFINARPGEVKKASFTIFNTGGQYSKINISNPNTWLRVTSWRSLSTTDELPLKVNIEAQGKDWNKHYSDAIYISLDKIQANVNVSMKTRLRFEIKNHNWHDVDFDNLKAWVKNRKNELDTGQILKGKTFRYRLNKITRKYQIRLRRDYSHGTYESA